MSRKVFIIDPQRSFCEVVRAPGNSKSDPPTLEDFAYQQKIHSGELCVPGAWEDCERTAQFIDAFATDIDDISITLDSHRQLHIAHPRWFTLSSGGANGVSIGDHPLPFTIMVLKGKKIMGYMYDASGSETEIGQFNAIAPKWTMEYLEKLQATGRYPHCIWPQHCLIGTLGHTVVPSVMDAIFRWEDQGQPKYHEVLTKGSNPRVEHFSAVQAEVVDPKDAVFTGLNMPFISSFMDFDEIDILGQALNFCVANTFRDMANQFPDDSFTRKCTLWIDGTSSVPGFQSLEDDFLNEFTARGMKTAKISDAVSVTV